MSNPSQLELLYEQDYVKWIEETCTQLENRELDQIDWTHLIEEVKSLGSEQKHKVDSYLLQLLIHLLLYKYWTTEKPYCQRGWKDEINNFRVQLEFLFESQTLYNYCNMRIETVYLKAKKRVIVKTELSPDIFPDTCPFSIEEIIDFDFLP